jgi:hypothetical protein
MRGGYAEQYLEYVSESFSAIVSSNG